MRVLSLTLLMTVAFSLTAPMSWASEPGTYRPGTPYQSIKAQNPTICQSQCQGDALCKGWNFLKVDHRHTVGICEFNSEDAAPVPSPVSISGANTSALPIAALQSGPVRTVRVGTPEVKTPPPHTPSIKAVAPRTAPVRVASVSPHTHAPHPVTRPTPIAPTAQLSLTEQQKLQRGTHVRQPHYNGQAVAPQRVASRAPAAPRYAPRSKTPQFRPQSAPQPYASNRAQAIRPATHQAARQATRGKPFRHSLDETPHVTPRFPNAPAPSAQYARPHTAPIAVPNQPLSAAPQPFQRQSTAHPQPARPNSTRPQAYAPAQRAPAPLPTEAAQSSLFGYLHDDVAVPRAVSPSEFAANTDTPIATVRAVPVAPVSVARLPRPIYQP